MTARPALAVAGAGVALVIAAILFGAVPLFVAGIGFVVLAALAPAWVALAGRSVTVERRLGVDRVIEDETLEAVVVVARGPLGLPGGELRDPLAGDPITLSEPLSLLPGRRRVTLRVVTRIHRRGRHVFAPAELTLTDAFGLARAHRVGSGPAAEVLVLPRTEPVRWRGRHRRRSGSEQSSRTNHEPMGAGDLDGLREYMPGTPASRIHWPALARYPSPPLLLERRLASEAETQPMIVLDARVGTGPRGEEHLDAAVRAAASLALALGRAGGCRLMLPGDALPIQIEPDLTAWPGAHTRLALVEPERDANRGPRLRLGATHGALIYVAGEAPAVPPWSSWRRRGPLMMVLPKGSTGFPGGVPSFEVAGCAGVPVRVRAGERGVAA